MRNLQVVTQTIHAVDYGEFNKFVKDVYGHDFEIVADQELGNDSQATFTAKKEPLDEYDQKKIDEFTATGNYNFLAHTLFNDLANRELIPEGEYLIEVCW